jgi:hypothetical protein
MKIKYVTMTGADDHTSPSDLADLSEKYPFAEWGILFSQTWSGVPRYPGFDWVLDLCAIAVSHPMNLCAHLCGKWVKDAMNGDITFLRDGELDSAFGRVQLNCRQNMLREAMTWEPVWQAMSIPKPIILGGDYTALKVDPLKFLSIGVSPLFDTSGGHGKLTKEWPKPWPDVLCGYAGGLGPHNLLKQLEKIEEAVGGCEIWIDMETHIRDGKEQFNLEKCKEVLELVKPWTG